MLYKLLFTILTYAASTGTLLLSGTVAVVNDIVITPSNNTTLNILSGEVAKNVGSVAETSNNVLGYKIYMYSNNAGELQHTGDNSKKTTYQVSYGGGSYVTPPLVGSPVQVKNVSSLSGLTTNNSTVLVNVTAYASAISGTYTDTITFSIVAN